jgi:hypothetical protein
MYAYLRGSMHEAQHPQSSLRRLGKSVCAAGHPRRCWSYQDVDSRDKPGHDQVRASRTRELCLLNVLERAMLADAAVAPPPAAAASATAATSATAASAGPCRAPSAATAATAAMASTTAGELYSRRPRLLLVEYVKCAEVDVRDLFLVKGNLLAGQRHFILRGNVRNCRVGRGGTTRQR